MFSKLNKRPPLVLIAVPCYDKVYAETATAVINLTKSQRYESIVSFFRGGLIHRSRNTLAKLFLEHPTKPDYILFVDSDMVFKADALEQLMDDHKDIVTGNAFSRQFPVKPVVGTFDQSRPGRVIHLLDYKKDALQPIDSCGMAFTLISRNAMEKVGKRPFDFIFFPESDGELPEDSAFCWRAKQAGLQVHLDSRVEVGHIGEYVYDERDFEASRPQLEEKLKEAGLPT